ncbi:hypothetical protein EV702DRAFT_1081971 [Suillus placidus]|uniref:Uncharacterized protein n=1 Tax=Suillus placidus TaxID=48579 RepID=A0A9P7D5L3_9AGAM|nr:hypothetical protein EV702DRAFT_1081971 [Suillus placidus]
MMYSYQTSKGIVHGLQWVPADATQIMLTGAQLPNTPGSAAGSFDLDLLGREDGVVYEKWYDQFPHSTYPSGPDPIALTASLSAPRGRSPYSARASSPMLLPPHSSYPRPPSHAPSPYQSRQQSRSPNPPHTSLPDVRPHPHAPSPYQSRRQSRSPYSPHRAPSPHVPPPQIIYPHEHVFEGQHVVTPQSQTLSPFPNAPAGPVFYSSPMPITPFHKELMSDSSPHPFARSPNTAQAYAPFSMIKIQDMDQFYSQIPSMPSVLDTHDINHQDWSTFMDNVALAWKGELPLPDFVKGRPPSIVADLINLWNNSFFLSRRVEIILYKGRERRSGPRAGTLDDQLSFPESDRPNERERKYSLYLTYVTPYVDGRTPTSYNGVSQASGTYGGRARRPSTYSFYS